MLLRPATPQGIVRQCAQVVPYFKKKRLRCWVPGAGFSWIPRIPTPVARYIGREQALDVGNKLGLSSIRRLMDVYGSGHNKFLYLTWFDDLVYSKFCHPTIKMASPGCITSGNKRVLARATITPLRRLNPFFIRLTRSVSRNGFQHWQACGRPMP